MRSTASWWTVAALVAALGWAMVLGACGDDDPAGAEPGDDTGSADSAAPDAGAPGADSPDAADVPAPEPHPLLAFYETLEADSLTWDFEEGAFHDDFGDAAFYGLAFYTRASLAYGDEGHTGRMAEAAAYNAGVLDMANNDPAWLLDNLEEVFMATLGTIEYVGLSGDLGAIDSLDALIGTMDELAKGFDDYIEVSVGQFAADLYGPTATTAGLALIHLQYAHFMPERDGETHVARAEEIVAAIIDKAWDTDHFKFRPSEDKLFLYPNCTMLAVLARAYQLTDKAEYLARAETVFGGIQPLKIAELGMYRSPYSQAYQGAETDEYGTLSAQNYLSLALVLLHQVSEDDTYLDEAVEIQEFVRTHLYDPSERKILHHWIDGRVAAKTDPDYFCSGCNMQVLYILIYLREEVGWTG